MSISVRLSLWLDLPEDLGGRRWVLVLILAGCDVFQHLGSEQTLPGLLGD